VITVGAIPNPVLNEMISTRRTLDNSQTERNVAGEISSEHAEALYGAVLKCCPLTVVEIGMACGYSTLAILTALKEGGRGGQLISIDPYQSTEFQGAGLNSVRRSGMEACHQLIEEVDYVALPELLKRKCKIDFAYIDGWHTFDYALLDFFYIDKMLNVQGIVAFNDAGYLAVHRVLRFLMSHRRYREIDVGLKRRYTGRNAFFTTARRLMGINTNDRYFQKIEAWEPDWHHFYARF
jgi:predicted O-methyltransferase YrrM